MPARHDWAALARSLQGEILLAGSEAYEWVRRPFIARFDVIEPEAVARCAWVTRVLSATSNASAAGESGNLRSWREGLGV